MRTLTAGERAIIAVRCENFVETVLKPKFLSEIRPTPFNFPVAIFGKWRGDKYSFITRYRSGHEHNKGEEFDSAFTRLDLMEESLDRILFHVMWHRHTGQWFRLFTRVSIEEALELVENNELLWPL